MCENDSRITIEEPQAVLPWMQGTKGQGLYFDIAKDVLRPWSDPFAVTFRSAGI
jgi:hypothetical protein